MSKLNEFIADAQVAVAGATNAALEQGNLKSAEELQKVSRTLRGLFWSNASAEEVLIEASDG